MILLFGLISFCFARETKMVMVFARHGSRYSDIESVEPSKRSQLTGNGMRMEYQLGRYIKEKFDGFLPKKFDNRRSYVIASGIDRTRQSAQSLMLGIYDFGSLSDPIEVDRKYVIPEWKDFDVEDTFKTALPEGYQPVPVHSYYPEHNFVFTPYDPTVCPGIASRFITKGPEVDELNRLLPSLIGKVKAEWNYSGVVPEVKTFIDILSLFDYAMSAKFLGKPVLSEPLLKQLLTFYSMATLVYFSDPEMMAFYTSELNKLQLSFLEAAKKGIDEKSEEYKKLVVMVGHDLNIFLLFEQLGYTSFECLRKKYDGVESETCYENPTFASSYFFEVYVEEGKYFADFVVNGKKKGFCTGNDSEKCSLDETIARLKSFTLPLSKDELLNKYCLLPEKNNDTYLKALIGFNLVVIAVIVYFIVNMKRKTNN